MRPPKCQDVDYIHFLVASPNVFSRTEAGRAQGPSPRSPAHDAFTRLLTRIEPDPETLWREAEGLIEPGDGVLVIDDSTLDKPYAEHIELVTSHWSGKHHRDARGINLITLLHHRGQLLRGQEAGGPGSRTAVYREPAIRPPTTNRVTPIVIARVSNPNFVAIASHDQILSV